MLNKKGATGANSFNPIIFIPSYHNIPLHNKTRAILQTMHMFLHEHEHVPNPLEKYIKGKDSCTNSLNLIKFSPNIIHPHAQAFVSCTI